MRARESTVIGRESSLLMLKTHAAKDRRSALSIRVRVDHDDAVLLDAVRLLLLTTSDTRFLKFQEAFPHVIVDQMTAARQ